MNEHMPDAPKEESKPDKVQKPLTALQQLEAQLKEARSKVTAEKGRIKKERTTNREKSHALMILGSIIARSGKDRMARALTSADWLKPEEVLAVEYYFELRERPKRGKKSADGSSGEEPNAQ